MAKEKKSKSVETSEEVEVHPDAISPIAKPMAEKKLSKKLLKVVKKASKKKHVKRGVKEVVKGLRKGEKGLVVFAGNVSPMDVMCEDASVPYCFVQSKEELGTAASTKRPTSVVMIVPGGKTGKDDLEDYKEVYDECFKTVKGLEIEA
ncbi:L30e-like protein [Basidiobolus meristosporus CBS 931.73]|uniref:H/ACA ribonucleoprotein complex subunit 2 n=1 Tax=Basidiobolus meristosporus CBS 931.73 TaxID=1314790 RepID=A0A1Y1Z7R1_9FUNG|nr:L30e-like protein [Basidiobolus meristosporus CBS 931.73]|eukprot:ORY06281.1 L30e-like protein [Basidiobolus meristosporus CBS 931.73]